MQVDWVIKIFIKAYSFCFVRILIFSHSFVCLRLYAVTLFFFLLLSKLFSLENLIYGNCILQKRTWCAKVVNKFGVFSLNFHYCGQRFEENCNI